MAKIETVMNTGTVIKSKFTAFTKIRIIGTAMLEGIQKKRQRKTDQRTSLN